MILRATHLERTHRFGMDYLVLVAMEGEASVNLRHAWDVTL